METYNIIILSYYYIFLIHKQPVIWFKIIKIQVFMNYGSSIITYYINYLIIYKLTKLGFDESK